MLFRIFRNIVSLLAGHIAAKLLSFVCIIFLARQLGVEQFGTYGTIMAYLTLFAAFADSGMTTIAIREISQDTNRGREYAVHILLLRLFLSTCAYGIMVLLGGLWKTDNYSWLFIASCGLFLFPEAIRKLAASIITAYERMELIAGLEFFSTIFRFTPFFLAMALRMSLQSGFIFLVAAWLAVAGVWFLITQRYCLQNQSVFTIHARQLWRILYDAFPLGIFFILSIIYFKADIIMLASMRGSLAVGFYESAYKFIEASMFIPVSIANVLLPVMSRNFVTDKSAYNQIYIHSTRLIAVAILPIVIGVSFFSHEIILLVYGKTYLPSAPALSLLIWALFLIFINAPIGNILVTSNLMHAFLPYAVGNTLLNILLNMLLIPRYGFLGASFTTVFTELTGFAIQLYFVRRVLGNISIILVTLVKIITAGVVASLVVYIAKPYGIIPLNILLLLSIYSVCILAFNVVTSKDKQLALDLLLTIKTKILP